MATKMLRGVAPLTMYRGAAGVGGLVYKNTVIDPRVVDAEDAKRLVGDGFLEWVVQDGESWKTTDGDSVTVGDVGLVDPNERDNGTVNSEASTVSEPDADEAKRTAARQKLAELGGTPDGRSSKDVWVEYAVGKGVDRAEAEKASKDELRDLLVDK